VREFIADRVDEIMENEQDDTITYWWTRAGMDPDAVVTEAIRNIEAFIVWDVMLSKIVNQSLNTSALGGTGGLDYMDLWNQQTTESARINVVREIFKRELPVLFWLSNDLTQPIAGGGFVQVQHDSFLIEADGAGGGANFAIFDLTKYASFAASFDAASDFPDPVDTDFPPFPEVVDYAPADEFSIGPLDAQTAIPKGNANLIPIFPPSGLIVAGTFNGVLYSPFGLGFRRCPAEIFNQFLGYNLMDQLTQRSGTNVLGLSRPKVKIIFKQSTQPAPVIAFAKGLQIQDDIFVDLGASNPFNATDLFKFN